VVLALMTQFPSQIRHSRAKSILEGLPHRLIFPNNRANEQDYAGFGLTEQQLGFILEGQGGPRRALWNGPTGSTLLDVDLSPLGPLLTVLGGGKAAEAAFGEDFVSKPFFWRKDDE
jgi:type IV secretion system protein VirB4